MDILCRNIWSKISSRDENVGRDDCLLQNEIFTWQVVNILTNCFIKLFIRELVRFFFFLIRGVARKIDGECISRKISRNNSCGFNKLILTNVIRARKIWKIIWKKNSNSFTASKLIGIFSRVSFACLRTFITLRLQNFEDAFTHSLIVRRST